MPKLAHGQQPAHTGSDIGSGALGCLVEWVVLEQVDDAGARLIALRLADGERRVLYATEQQSPLRANVHPEAKRIAVDVKSRGCVRGRARTRVGLINLERRGVGWLKQSLDPKWRVARAVFDDTGTRLALEGAYDGVPISDIYVLEVTLSGNSVRDKLLAGAGNPDRLGCGRPIFVDGGKQVIYLRNTRPEGAWELAMIEIERPGDSATLLEGRAPSVLSLTLTDGAMAVPDVPMAYCHAIKQVFWAGFARGGSRHQLRTARLGVRPHTDLGRSHQRIEEVAVSSGGELVACSADGRLWLTETETGATVALLDGVSGASHRGLAFDEAQKRLLFCTNDGEGARLCAVDLVSRTVSTVCELGDVTILSLHALRPDAAISKRMEAYESVLDESAPAPDATAIQQLPPVTDEPVADSIEALGGSQEAAPAADEAAATEPAEPGEELEINGADTAVIDAATIAAVQAAAQAADDSADDVLTSAPTDAPGPVAAVSSAPPEPAPTAPEPPADVETSGVMDISTSFSVETSPADALAGWLKQVAEFDDPTESLQSFEAARDDQEIREAARLFLGTQRRRAAGASQAPIPLLMGIVVAGHLHLNEARSELQSLCKRGRERVGRGDLLEADEHFALASLLYIDGHSTRFGWATIHQNYTNMFERLGDVLEREGEGPAGRMMAAFCEGYARQLDGVLAVVPPDAAAEFDPAKYRAQSLADMAAQATEEAERQKIEARQAAEAEAARQAAEAEAARQAAEAEAARQAQAEAEAEAARQAAEAEAARQQAEYEAARQRAEAEAARQAAAEAARKAEEARQQAEYEAARRAAEAEAARQAAAAEAARKAEEARQQAEYEAARQAAEAEAARVKAEEERIWAERRKAAEDAALAAKQQQEAEQRAAEEAAQRAAQAAAAKLEAAERARQEAEAAIAAAEAAARLQSAAPAPRAPLVSKAPAPQNTFNPLSTPGSRDPRRTTGGTPAAIPAAQPAAPAAARSDLPDFTDAHPVDESIDMPVVSASGGLPPIMSIAGLFGAASGIACLLLGLKFSMLMLVLGVAWIAAGVALFSDKIWGWGPAIGVFAINAIHLIVVGLGDEPTWFVGIGSVFWGVSAIGFAAALLHPSVRARYGPKRRKF